MLRGDEARAASTAASLQDMRQFLEGEGDAESARFLRVLQVWFSPLVGTGDCMHDDWMVLAC